MQGPIRALDTVRLRSGFIYSIVWREFQRLCGLVCAEALHDYFMIRGAESRLSILPVAETSEGI